MSNMEVKCKEGTSIRTIKIKMPINQACIK